MQGRHLILVGMREPMVKVMGEAAFTNRLSLSTQAELVQLPLAPVMALPLMVAVTLSVPVGTMM